MATEGKTAPRIREDLEITSVQHEDGNVWLIRDDLGLIEKPVVVRTEALAVLRLLDGNHSVEDIQEELVRSRGGVFVSRAEIEAFLGELDARGVLDTAGFRRARRKFIHGYRRLAVRTPFLAGRSYPADKRDLERYLDGLLLSAGTQAAGPWDVCALAAPHIEIENGREVYARAYGALRGASPRRVVLLGTGHTLDGGYFSVSAKDFETPLGIVGTDREAVERLRLAGGEAVADSDIAHRREHSLEFQLIFLQRLLGPTFSLVPVLCGSFRAGLASAARPSELPGAAGFVGELRDMVGDWGDSVLCVAGVDFSHIGPKFGDSRDARALRPEAARHDGALIEAACRADVEGLWRESRRVADRYNVCGFSSLACLLEIMPEAEGVTLGHEFWHEEETRSAVSFAAIVFHRKPDSGHRGGSR
jgi:AmmeMemoRadiSam system protein B